MQLCSATPTAAGTEAFPSRQPKASDRCRSLQPTPPDQPDDDPAVIAAKAASLAGFGRDRLTCLRWAHAVACGSEDLERLAAPPPDTGSDRYYRVARACVAELAILLGTLCASNGIDPDEYLLNLIATQTVANNGDPG